MSPITRFAACAAALLVACASSNAGAQQPTLATGTPIRVSATVLPKRVEGTFLSVARDTLFFANRDGLQYRIALAAVTRIEVGSRSRLAGAARGALWGAAVGCLLDCTQAGSQGWTPLEALGAVATTAAIGAGIGAILRANHWTTVELPHATTVVATADTATHAALDSAAMMALIWAPAPGMRVRLRSDDAPSRTTGTVVRRTSDTLYVSRGPAQLRAIPRVAIRTIEVSDGIDHRAGVVRGALWTIGAGAAVGSVMCAANPKCGTGYGAKPNAVNRFGIGAIEGGVIGVVLSPAGMVIGGQIGVERWIPFR